MTKYISKILLAIALMATIFAACKKDHKDDTGNTTCRINTVAQSAGTAKSTFNIQYNADGTVMAINATGTVAENKVFTWYNKNTALVRDYYAPTNQLTGLDSLTINNAGYLLNERSMTSYRTDWTNWAYTLNTDNEVQSTLITTSGGKTIPSDIYIYSNGNLIQQGSTKYVYDTSKPATPGDYHSANLLIYEGLQYSKSKNLVTRVINTPDTLDLQYKYDSQNRIVEMDYLNKGAVRAQYSYGYDCR